MIARTEELNRTMPGRAGVVWPAEIDIGIGLNSGLCCVGNMGTKQHLSYSLIGDTVNMASRFEGLTKQYHVPIIAGPVLAARLGGFALLELDRVRVVGRDAPESVFALLGDETVSGETGFARLAEGHSAMLAAYRAQRWDEAEAALAAGQPEYEAYALAGLRDLYLKRIGALGQQPPGEDWDGVYQATEK